MPRLFVVLIALAALSGCGAHSDRLTMVQLAGTVSLPDGAADSLVTIEVRDVNLDDTRPPDLRVILRQDVAANRRFVLGQSYFWGTSERDPFRDGRIAISIEAPGCQGWRQEFGMPQILNDEYNIVLEIGEIRIDCG